MKPYRSTRTYFNLAFIFLVLVSFSSDSAAVVAQSKKKDKTGAAAPPTDVNQLSMEVNALRTLYLLRGADPEFAVGNQNPEVRLGNISKNKQFAACAPKQDKKREPAEVSGVYRQTLVDLRSALIMQDDDRIEKLDKQLLDLQENEMPDVDDEIEITDEAKKEASLFVKSYCSADQVVAYLASYGKELPNPRRLLFKAMRVHAVPGKPKAGVSGVKPTPEEWKEIREFTIREVSVQLSGLNATKGDNIAARLGELLDKAYAMSEEELHKNSLKLRQDARKITDAVGPLALIKNIIERDVAEMLSNPRLVPAAKAALQYSETKKKPSN